MNYRIGLRKWGMLIVGIFLEWETNIAIWEILGQIFTSKIIIVIVQIEFVKLLLWKFWGAACPFFELRQPLLLLRFKVNVARLWFQETPTLRTHWIAVSCWREIQTAIQRNFVWRMVGHWIRFFMIFFVFAFVSKFDEISQQNCIFYRNS